MLLFLFADLVDAGLALVDSGFPLLFLDLVGERCDRGVGGDVEGSVVDFRVCVCGCKMEVCSF